MLKADEQKVSFNQQKSEQYGPILGLEQKLFSFKNQNQSCVNQNKIKGGSQKYNHDEDRENVPKRNELCVQTQANSAFDGNASHRYTYNIECQYYHKYGKNDQVYQKQKKWPKTCKNKYKYLQNQNTFNSNLRTSQSLASQKEYPLIQKSCQQIQSPTQTQKQVFKVKLNTPCNKKGSSYLKNISNKVKEDLKFNHMLNEFMSSQSKKDKSQHKNGSQIHQNIKFQLQSLIKSRQKNISSKKKFQKYPYKAKQIFVSPFSIQKKQIKLKSYYEPFHIQESVRQKQQNKVANKLPSKQSQHRDLFKQFQLSNKGQKSKQQYEQIQKIVIKKQYQFNKKQQKKSINPNQYVQISQNYAKSQKNELDKEQHKQKNDQTLKSQFLLQSTLKVHLQRLVQPLVNQIQKLNYKVQELLKKDKQHHHQSYMIYSPEQKIHIRKQSSQSQESKIYISLSSQPDIKISASCCLDKSQTFKENNFQFLQVKSNQIKKTDSIQVQVQANSFEDELLELENVEEGKGLKDSQIHKSQINYMLEDASSQQEFYYT